MATFPPRPQLRQYEFEILGGGCRHDADGVSTTLRIGWHIDREGRRAAPIEMRMVRC